LRSPHILAYFALKEKMLMILGRIYIYFVHAATSALLGGHGVDHRCCIPKRSVLRGMKPGPKHELAIERTPFYLTGAGGGQEMVRKRRI
jgi:hypothetical protein